MTPAIPTENILTPAEQVALRDALIQKAGGVTPLDNLGDEFIPGEFYGSNADDCFAGGELQGEILYARTLLAKHFKPFDYDTAQPG